MILVSLGTHERPFYRLVKEIERLIQTRKIKEKVVIQLGYTDYKVKNAECHNFIEFEKMRKYIKKCRMIITHGGVGSIMDALNYDKLAIVVPRRKKLNEHSDDHQMQITKMMEKEGMVIPVYDIKNLEKSIYKTNNFKIKMQKKEKPLILNIVEKKLMEWENK